MQGRVLAGRYRLESQLGIGGMGSVWRAEHLTLHSAVAVKLMDPTIAATVGGADRFRREAQAAASLRSAHVVQVLDYGVDDGTPFLVMELLQGENLASCLAREHRLSPERTLAIMTQVARAMARAHASNIVHRDLKPDNVFLVKEDDQELVKVLDFGIAKTADPTLAGVQTRTGMTLGTPYYMSPEQAEGRRAVDHRTDLWAMAVIATECITGIRPFNGETWGELLLNICARPLPVPSTQAPVPPGFDAWFARATSREPGQRFGSAQELVEALRGVVGSPSTLSIGSLGGHGPGALVHPTTTGTAPAATVDEPVTIPTRRGLVPVVLVVGGLLASGAVALVGFAVYRARAPADSDETPVSASDAGSNDSRIAAGSATTSSPSDVVPTGPSPTPPRVTPRIPPTPLAAEARSPAVASVAAPVRPLPLPSAPARALSSRERSAAPVAPGGLRCYQDPFTGAVRLEGSGQRPAGAQVFPCKQNAFTGQYQRL
jgi:serine/threonine-protein kinase